MQMVMTQVGLDDDTPISMGILGRTIENAQKSVESHNYDIRKRLVEYDDVLNQQRGLLYGLRKKVLEASEVKIEDHNSKDDEEVLIGVAEKIGELQDQLDRFALTRKETWNIDLLEKLSYKFNPLEVWMLKKELEHIELLFSSQTSDDSKVDNIEERKLYIEIKNLLTDEIFEKAAKSLGYKDSIELFRKLDELKTLSEKQDILKKILFISFMNHIQSIGSQPTKGLCQILILQSIDRFWMEHLDTMSDLREGISLRNLAQRDPLVEYKNEGFALFDQMLSDIDNSVVTRFFKVRLVQKDNTPQQQNTNNQDNRPGKTGKVKTIKKNKKVGRNDPCPCGSGKKYKKCCAPKYD
jgi:preprotein translocase subunit SecA